MAGIPRRKTGIKKKDFPPTHERNKFQEMDMAMMENLPNHKERLPSIISPERRAEVRRLIEPLFAHLDFVEEETVAGLGEKDAFKITEFYVNAWLDVTCAMAAEYKESLDKSLLALRWQELYKELIWMQKFFLCAHYRQVYATLRYIWETVSQAHLIDHKFPELSLIDKLEKLIPMELISKKREASGWKAIEKSLALAFRRDEQKVKNEFWPIWKYLCKNAHPSVVTLSEIMEAEASLHALFIETFNERLAKECLDCVSDVMDPVFVSVIGAFPKITERVRLGKSFGDWERLLPCAYGLIL
jgi:hypothetical protein